MSKLLHHSLVNNLQIRRCYFMFSICISSHDVIIHHIIIPTERTIIKQRMKKLFVLTVLSHRKKMYSNLLHLHKLQNILSIYLWIHFHGNSFPSMFDLLRNVFNAHYTFRRDERFTIESELKFHIAKPHCILLCLP